MGRTAPMLADPEVRVADQEVRPFYTPATLAQRLSLSERTVKDMLKAKEIPSYKIGASRRIDPADVDSYLAAHREERTAA